MSLSRVGNLSTKLSTDSEGEENQKHTKSPLKPQVSVSLDPAMTLKQQKAVT